MGTELSTFVTTTNFSAFSCSTRLTSCCFGYWVEYFFSRCSFHQFLFWVLFSVVLEAIQSFGVCLFCCSVSFLFIPPGDAVRSPLVETGALLRLEARSEDLGHPREAEAVPEMVQVGVLGKVVGSCSFPACSDCVNEGPEGGGGPWPAPDDCGPHTRSANQERTFERCGSQRNRSMSLARGHLQAQCNLRACVCLCLGKPATSSARTSCVRARAQKGSGDTPPNSGTRRGGPVARAKVEALPRVEEERTLALCAARVVPCGS